MVVFVADGLSEKSARWGKEEKRSGTERIANHTLPAQEGAMLHALRAYKEMYGCVRFHVAANIGRKQVLPSIA